MQDSALKRALGYRRFGETPRVLLFDSGYLVVEDVADAALDLGWVLGRLKTPLRGEGSPDFVRALLAALVEWRPDYVLTINHLGFDENGALAGLLADLEIATASWFVDHPLPILGGAPANVTSLAQIFCFERNAIGWLAAQGFEDVAFLPTASNARYFKREKLALAQTKRLAGALTFAGNSWWSKARLEPAKWARKAAKPLSHPRGVEAVLSDRFRSRLGKKRLPEPRGAYAVAQTVLAEASLRRRGELARALAPLGLRVHGDPHWKTLAPDVELAGFVDYKSELPALFAASAINANVTAAQMPTAVNQRVFDVPAVGGFLLTDAQEDALELFREDEEIVVYRDPAEAADKARYYAGRDAERARIAARAQRVVDEVHRYTHRAEMIHEQMKQRFG